MISTQVERGSEAGFSTDDTSPVMPSTVAIGLSA